MSTDIPQTETETENAQLPSIFSGGPVDLVCPTDGTILAEHHKFDDGVYECPTCRTVHSEEVLRR